jgi:hypothetical protein
MRMQPTRHAALPTRFEGTIATDTGGDDEETGEGRRVRASGVRLAEGRGQAEASSPRPRSHNKSTTSRRPWRRTRADASTVFAGKQQAS